MKFIIAGPLKNTIYNLMRDTGYHFQREEKRGAATEYSFVRPKVGFPRFHIYAKIENGNLSINLHLDQKKTVYQGTTAHSGDYDEPVVLKEAERIKQTIQNSGI
jgi:hypothetical protein